MNTKPLISVVIATYMREKLLKKTLSSILQQTYTNLEIIVVSDGCNPLVHKVCSVFKDIRIRSFEIPHSGRPALPRNFGISRAPGEYVAFCDDDDIWAPSKIEDQVKTVKLHPEIKLCYTNINIIDENDNVISSENKEKINPLTFNDLLFKNDIAFSSIMVKRDILRIGTNFDERMILKASEDYLFLLRVISKYPIVYIHKPLVKYRIHEKGISRCIGIKKYSFYYIRLVLCFLEMLKSKKISLSKFFYLLYFHFIHLSKQNMFPLYNSINVYRRKKHV